MKINLLVIGERMPQWINDGYIEYAKRLPPECSLRLLEIPAPRRTKGTDHERVLRQEGERMLAALPKDVTVWALDEHGEHWSSAELASHLSVCLRDGHNLALLVGGADGLAVACKTRAQRLWSLSRLTFPHFLVKVMVAEQIYRAWTMINGHPYHRG